MLRWWHQPSEPGAARATLLTLAERVQLFLVEGARFLLQHDRYAIADRIGEAGGPADQLLRASS